MDTQQKKGLWRYGENLPYIDPKFRISLGEGNTPFYQKGGIYFKCEYTNPTGSVKDRSLAFQISKVKEEGIKDAVISSSGNAAISAAVYCQKANIHLTIFLSYHINPQKMDALVRLKCNYKQSLTPIRAAFEYANKYNAYNLRQSQDPNALPGYETIAYEAGQFQSDIDAIFVPVSSGTTFEGMWNGYQKIGYAPSFHAVQTEAVHPIAASFDTSFHKHDKSIADGIVARVTNREKQVKEIISKTGGWGWIVDDISIRQAHTWLSRHATNTSFEGAAALAGLWKAQKSGYTFQKPLCLLTGAWRE